MAVPCALCFKDDVNKNRIQLLVAVSITCFIKNLEEKIEQIYA